MIGLSRFHSGRMMLLLDIRRYLSDYPYEPKISSLKFSPDGRALAVGIARVGTVVIEIPSRHRTSGSR